ncbi:hypothetical protein B0H11DRAFT_2068934, partial [Mycena galericulata]
MASSPGAIPAADAAALAAAVAHVKEIFATSFIGFAVATTAYGICVLQCYLYFRNYPKDNIFLKMTVLVSASTADRRDFVVCASFLGLHLTDGTQDIGYALYDHGRAFAVHILCPQFRKPRCGCLYSLVCLVCHRLCYPATDRVNLFLLQEFC